MNHTNRSVEGIYTVKNLPSRVDDPMIPDDVVELAEAIAGKATLMASSVKGERPNMNHTNRSVEGIYTVKNLPSRVDDPMIPDDVVELAEAIAGKATLMASSVKEKDLI